MTARASLRSIQGHVTAAGDTPVSTSTISRRLAERYLSSRLDRRIRVWRRPGQRHDPRFIVEMHTTSTRGLMVWGTIPASHWWRLKEPYRRGYKSRKFCYHVYSPSWCSLTTSFSSKLMPGFTLRLGISVLPLWCKPASLASNVPRPLAHQERVGPHWAASSVSGNYGGFEGSVVPVVAGFSQNILSLYASIPNRIATCIPAVVQRLDHAAPTKANPVRFPVGKEEGGGRSRIFSCGNRWQTMPLLGGFSRSSPVRPVLAFQRCSILTSLRSRWMGGGEELGKGVGTDGREGSTVNGLHANWSVIYGVQKRDGAARKRSRHEGTIRATLTRTPSASSLLRARRALTLLASFTDTIAVGHGAGDVCQGVTSSSGPTRGQSDSTHVRDMRTESLPRRNRAASSRPPDYKGRAVYTPHGTILVTSCLNGFPRSPPAAVAALTTSRACCYPNHNLSSTHTPRLSLYLAYTSLVPRRLPYLTVVAPHSPPSAFTHSRLHSSVSHPLVHSSHEHLTRRRPAISSRRPHLTSLTHARQMASVKDCRPLGCGNVCSVLGRHLESSPTRVMRQPFSPEHSCVVAKHIGNSSRREEVCDASKSRRCRPSRDSLKGGEDIHERIVPGRGEGDVGLRLRRGAAEPAPAAARNNTLNITRAKPTGSASFLVKITIAKLPQNDLLKDAFGKFASHERASSYAVMETVNKLHVAYGLRITTCGHFVSVFFSPCHRRDELLVAHPQDDLSGSLWLVGWGIQLSGLVIAKGLYYCNAPSDACGLHDASCSVPHLDHCPDNVHVASYNLPTSGPPLCNQLYPKHVSAWKNVSSAWRKSQKFGSQCAGFQVIPSIAATRGRRTFWARSSQVQQPRLACIGSLEWPFAPNACDHKAIGEVILPYNSVAHEIPIELGPPACDGEGQFGDDGRQGSDKWYQRETTGRVESGIEPAGQESVADEMLPSTRWRNIHNLKSSGAVFLYPNVTKLGLSPSHHVCVRGENNAESGGRPSAPKSRKRVVEECGVKERRGQNKKKKRGRSTNERETDKVCVCGVSGEGAEERAKNGDGGWVGRCIRGGSFLTNFPSYICAPRAWMCAE
ncbi:hypothetical protein PR048_015115 [Dryococelus australis]|uniref:Uncharacterized protein n=1 Tax=Dryococelus australis TaxID=614101 RepID=A0ABQ9HG26_9NEOP|nr:hypothetical protein PR048_015115 [Dryococelus australis]